MSLRAATALALFLIATAAAAAPLEPPTAKEKWLVLNADEFRFISNVSPAATVEIARDMLRMRAAIGRITMLNVRAPLPTRVFIFPNERRFRGYRDTVLERKSDSITGLFLTTQSGNFILLQGDAPGGVDHVVYHELTHYFVRNTSARLPLWLNEGLAEYYATFRTTRDAVQIGRPVVHHVQWLRERPFIPMRELFAMTVDSPEYNEGSRQGAFYAQSWALVHYLMIDDARRAKLREFLQLLSAGKTIDDAFAGAFAIPFATLENEVRAYVRKRGFAFTSYALGEIAVPEPPQPAPLPHDAVLFELGSLLGRSTRAAAPVAERFLHAALEHNPKNAGAHASLGRLHDAAGRRAEADAAYAKAVQLGSDDAEVCILAGTSLFERFSKHAAGSTEVPKDDLRRARELFKRATELDPNSPLALTGLGASYIGESDVAPGIAALEKSLALAPGHDEATFYLVQLYGRAGRYAEARTAGTALLSRTSEPTIRQFIRSQLEHINEVESANAITTRMNEAVAKANRGKHDEALAIVDATLPTITDPAMLQHAKEFRNQLAEIAAKKKKK